MRKGRLLGLFGTSYKEVLLIGYAFSAADPNLSSRSTIGVDAMATSPPTKNVVTNAVLVGVDGSEASLQAVDWAAQEARNRGAPLTLLHVTQWPVYGMGWFPAGDGPTQETVANAEREILAHAEARAQRHGRDLTITSERRDDYPSDVILELGRDAQLIVLGRRGSGGFFNLALGSTAYQVAHQSQRPVVLVPAAGEPAYSEPSFSGPGVLVGVDFTEDSQEAVGFAFEEASLRQLPLTAIRAWSHPVFDAPIFSTPFQALPEDYLAEQEQVLSENLAGWGEKHPGVAVHRSVAHGHPAHVLLKAALDADLLVVGSRRRRGVGVPRLGSISDALVRHARCPVAVVRAGSDMS